MKSTILTLLALFIFIGCSGNQPSPKIQDNKIINKQTTQPVKEEYERTVSYQDIIMKINDINTKKKTNKRVKEIIKEYQYNTSDDDSKNSARKKALNQVKILILEEIGVFVESYLELNKVVENEKYQKYFKQEIKNLTAGIIKTKILDEKYDGKTYYLKASVLVDPDSVSEGISEILKIKANKSEIEKLTTLLQAKEQEIDMRSYETIKLQKKITNQSLLNQAKENENKELNKKLLKYKLITDKFNIIISENNKKLNFIASKIKTTTKENIIHRREAEERLKTRQNGACLLTQGMSYYQVEDILGKPDKKYNNKQYSSDDGSSMSIFRGNFAVTWYYGEIQIIFKLDEVLKSMVVYDKSGCSL